MLVVDNIEKDILKSKTHYKNVLNYSKITKTI